MNGWVGGGTNLLPLMDQVGLNFHIWVVASRPISAVAAGVNDCWQVLVMLSLSSSCRQASSRYAGQLGTSPLYLLDT